MSVQRIMPVCNAIETSVSDNVGFLSLNRPDRMNAINNGIRKGIVRALSDLDSDPAVRAIVVHGGSSRAFCVGADITEQRERRPPVGERRSQMDGNHWVDAFDQCPKPLIAAVHGYCLGGGVEIALACDIRVASLDATFGLPETGLGLIPGAGGTQRLPKLIGLARALDLLLTGDRIDADKALQIGFVTRLADQGQSALDAATGVARQIAARGPLASQYVKEAAKAAMDMPLEAGLTLERSLFALLWGTDDRAEAALAFKEKRPPRFNGT